MNHVTNTLKGSWRRRTVMAGVLGVAVLTAGMTTAAHAERYARTTADLNVRSCASTSCEVIHVLKEGQCVLGLQWAAGKTWAKVRFRRGAGGVGFCSAAYLTRAPECQGAR